MASNLIPWSSRPRTGARAIAEQLVKAGLIGSDNLLMGNPGSGEHWLYLELTDYLKMGLAEPAVGSMLDGASRIKSKPAIAIAHGFVGFSGLQGSVFNAAQRQSPLLVIVGTADSHAHTGETHMYADVEGAAKAARAKYVKNATDPATLLRDLRDAIIEAQIPPFGPVVFIVGSNVANAPNTEPVIVPKLPNCQLAPPYSEIEILGEELLKAEKPTLLVGDGIARSQAHQELLAVAEALGADVWASMESEVNFPRIHALYRGNLGHMDDARGRDLLKAVDCAVAVGTPVYQTVFNSKLPLFSPNTVLAAINYDPETSLRGHNDITLPIKGDPKRILGMLLTVIQQKQTATQRDQAKQRLMLREQEKSALMAQRRTTQLAQPGVTIAKFGYFLEQRLKDLSDRPIIFNEALEGAVGLTDYLENVNIPGKYFDTSGGSLGEWGGAVGASLIHGRTIVFIGDGGFHYPLQALWNAAQEKLPLGLVVVHNGTYGLLYSNLDAALRQQGIDPASMPHPHYYDLPGIDYVKIAEGYGIPGMRVDQESQIEVAIDKMLHTNSPFLIDLILN